MTNKLSVLVVEDNDKDSEALVAEIKAHADKLSFAGVSTSSNHALEFILNHKPHAVILDLELQKGIGDGLDLLEQLQSTVLCPKPYIIINTNNSSQITSIKSKKLGADYEFAKWQKGYTPKMVIEHLLRVMPEILGYEEEPPAPLTEQQLENKMRDFVQNEFNNLGVRAKNEGYDYLVDAVILAAKGEYHNWGKIIGGKIKKDGNAVMHAMQYAIDRTWTKTDTITLAKNYTAPLPKGKTAPTVVDFVFFYKQKLISYINK